MAVKLRLQKTAARMAATTDRMSLPRYGQAKRRARRKFFMLRLTYIHAGNGFRADGGSRAVVTKSPNCNKAVRERGAEWVRAKSNLEIRDELESKSQGNQPSSAVWVI